MIYKLWPLKVETTTNMVNTFTLLSFEACKLDTNNQTK